MKRPHKIFVNHPELMDDPEVKELIAEYDKVCDELILLDQSTEMKMTPLQPLKQLVAEIKQGIADAKEQDELAIRFKETPRVDFKEAVTNLENYIEDYLRTHKLYL